MLLLILKNRLDVSGRISHILFIFKMKYQAVRALDDLFNFNLMKLYEFKQTLSEKEPPSNVAVYLQALWFDAKGDWDKAHEIVQDVNDENASWVHAYLHRKEGDVFNSDYWYNRAGKKRARGSLQNEWEEIVQTML